MHMNAAHWHLLLNHLPVLGTLFSAILLAVAIFLKNAQFQRVSLVFLLCCALAAIPVYLTGNAAEGIVEKLPEASEEIIEAHERMGTITLIVMQLLAFASVVVLFAWRKAPEPSPRAALAVLLFALICTALAGYTANLGGQVRHTEIRPTASR